MLVKINIYLTCFQFKYLQNKPFQIQVLQTKATVNYNDHANKFILYPHYTKLVLTKFV